MTTSIRVAIVAPSLRILGGHSVQADRMLHGWQRDPEVSARLVPINPLPPRGLRWTSRIKYVRTLINMAVYLPSLVRELRDADVVHVFSASYFSFVLTVVPAVLIARALGRPVVVNYHSGEAPDHLRRSFVARGVLRSADRLAVPSAFLAEVFARHGLDAAVVPNTVDTAVFAFSERKTPRPRLLSTRNLTYPYNVAATLRTFRLVQDRFPDASLTIVGGGPDEPALRALAAALDLKHVTFAGRVDPGAIHRYYATHDIYLQSPDIDNMPLSVLEACASGLPIVSTDVGGIPVLLRHGSQALLAPADDAVQLAAHVRRLLEEPGLAGRLAAAAREACGQYEWRVVRQQWLDLYRSVLTAPAVRHAAMSGSAP